MMDDRFFFELPAAPTLPALLRGAAPFMDAPRDWSVALCDIVGSTRAVRSGRMQEINLVGVGFITALINLWRPDHAAFVFGGDGAFALLPPHLSERAAQICREIRLKTADVFGFELRADVFSVAELCANGAALKVGKVQDDGFAQAAFTGGAVSVAERLLRDRHESASAPRTNVSATADFDGLTCPWRPVAVAQGAIASILVEVTDADLERRHARIADVIELLGRVLGRSPPGNPISEADLAAADDNAQIDAVKKVTGLDAMAVAATPEEGRRGTVRNTDYLRFDDMLRCTVRVADDERIALEAALEAQRSKGDLFYGVSYSRAALITCILKGSDTDIALIDGAQGGYASAATMLKAQKNGR